MSETTKTQPEQCGACRAWYPTLDDVFSHACPAINAATGRAIPDYAAAGAADIFPAQSQAAQSAGAGRSSATGNSPTDKQVSYFRSLVEQKIAPEARAAFTDAVESASWTKAKLSDVIDSLRSMPYLERKPVQAAGAAKAAPAGRTEPEEGFYLVESAGAEPTVYKVQRSQTGNLYAKQLDNSSGSFDYVGRSPFRSLTEDTKLTLERAAQFGQLYGMCCICGRTLTDESSIAAGIGPICAAKF